MYMWVANHEHYLFHLNRYVLLNALDNIWNF